MVIMDKTPPSEEQPGSTAGGRSYGTKTAGSWGEESPATEEKSSDARENGPCDEGLKVFKLYSVVLALVWMRFKMSLNGLDHHRTYSYSFIHI